MKLLTRGLIALGCVVSLHSALSSPALATDTLITLGTAGGPIPRDERAQVSNLVVVNGEHYLIDAGDGLSRRLAQAKVKLTDIKHIFLTHLHDDHYAGLATFFGYVWQYNPDSQITIYGPGETKSVVDGAIAFQSANTLIRGTEKSLPPPTDLFVAKEITEGEVYRDQNVSISASPNTHFHFKEGTPPYGKTTSLSYKVETPERTIVFTGDTGRSDQLVEFTRGADLLVVEVLNVEETVDAIKAQMSVPMTDEQLAARRFHMEEEHLTPQAVGELATEAGVKKVILSHFPPRMDGDQTFSDYVDLVRKSYAGPVVAAKDLDRF